MNIVEVQIKSVYGNELVYPVNENACKFAQLIGKKTLSMRDIAYIKGLGFTIKVIERTL
jgi:hypothetical protein